RKRLILAFTALVSASTLAAPGSAAADVSFTAAGAFPAGSAPESVAIGVLNGDAAPDLVVANVGSDDVSVLLGKGDGTFGTAASFAAGSRPRSVAIGDVNGDGRPDLVVVVYRSDAVSILLEKGGGTFGQATGRGHRQLPARAGRHRRR